VPPIPILSVWTDQTLSQIIEDIDYYDIPIYNFPYDPEEDDEETIQDNMELRVSESIPRQG
jgi:septin family protein